MHRLLGTAPDERLVELVDACIAADAGRALALANEALASGVQLASLGDQLLDYLRDMIVVGVGADGVALVGVAERLAVTCSGKHHPGVLKPRRPPCRS